VREAERQATLRERSIRWHQPANDCVAAFPIEYFAFL